MIFLASSLRTGAGPAVGAGGEADVAGIHDRGYGWRLQLERRVCLGWGGDDRRLLGQEGLPARAGA